MDAHQHHLRGTDYPHLPRSLPSRTCAKLVVCAATQNFEPSAFIAKFPDWCAELFAPLPSNYATAQMSHYRIAPSEPWPKISIGTWPRTSLPPPSTALQCDQAELLIFDGRSLVLLVQTTW